MYVPEPGAIAEILAMSIRVLLSAHTIHSPNHLNENFWYQNFIK
jgi:hypothetical protein